MSSHSTIADFSSLETGTLPTPDALMAALLEQQKLLEENNEVPK